MEPHSKENPNLSCRFYENIYPAEGEIVIVEIDKIVENGAYVKLLEYDNIEGMITPNEITKLSNMKSVYRVMKTGKQEVVQVLKVDQRHGYIDLSKKRVQAEEIKECEEKYARCKVIHSILRTIAQKREINIEELYKLIVWPITRSGKNPFNHFKKALT